MTNEDRDRQVSDVVRGSVEEETSILAVKRCVGITTTALLLLLAGGLSAAGHAQQASPATAPLVFEGVTVVDVERGRFVPNQRVVIRGNRITAMGGADVGTSPPGANVVDARGRYLIPGLWDMHVHLEPGGAERLSEFLAYGVTGLREMGQRGHLTSDSFNVWQQDILAGRRVGPRRIGPSADFSDIFVRYPKNKQTPEEARRLVDSLEAAGDAFLKFHAYSDDPAIFFGVLSEARKVGIPVTGHLPSSVTLGAAVDSGLAGVEHVFAFWPQCFPLFSPWPPGPHDLNAKYFARLMPDDPLQALAECRVVIPKLIQYGTWLAPTPIAEFYVRPRHIPAGQALLYLLHRHGVTNFLNASDYVLHAEKASGGQFLPGRSALENLELLAGAGLPPLMLLQAATLNPARYLNGTDSLGTVAVGKLADLVLLGADPLADIRHVRTIEAVIANGRYFDRAALDRLLVGPDGTP